MSNVPPKPGPLSKGLGNVGTALTVYDILARIASAAKESIDSGLVKFAFVMNEEQLTSYAAKLDEFIEESGEGGALFGMFCLKEGVTGIGQIYPGPMIVGAGSDPQDALDKYYLAGQKIDEEVPLINVAAEQSDTIIKPPEVGDECFGIWVGAGKGVDAREIVLIEDFYEKTIDAHNNFLAYNSNILLVRNKEAVEQLVEKQKLYTDLLVKYKDAAVAKNVFGTLADLIQSNANAASKFQNAANMAQKAIDRERRYKFFNQFGAILGLGAAAVNLAGAMQANASADKGYWKTVYETHKAVMIGSEGEIKTIFMGQFSVDGDVVFKSEITDIILDWD